MRCSTNAFIFIRRAQDKVLGSFFSGCRDGNRESSEPVLGVFCLYLWCFECTITITLAPPRNLILWCASVLLRCADCVDFFSCNQFHMKRKDLIFHMKCFVRWELDALHFFFSEWDRSLLLRLFDKSPLLQTPRWLGRKHSEPLRRWLVMKPETFVCCAAVKKTDCSDRESWIYSGQCNSLNICSCPFIIINQRAAGPKEQFRALRSYAVAESVISLRKII